MGKPLVNLFVKELRVLFRDPTLIVGTIVIPVLIFPLMGSAIRVSTQATEQQLADVEVSLLNLDPQDGNGSYADLFFAALLATNLTVNNLTSTSVSDAVNRTATEGAPTLVVLPANFSERIGEGHSAQVAVYQVLRTFGPGELGGSQRVLRALAQFNAAIAAQRAQAGLPNATAEEALYPARADSRSIVNGEVRSAPPEAVVSAVLASALTLPLVVGIMILLAAQLAATSVATEKEEKTLEVLLTLPTSRMNILLGKLAGVFIVSIVETASVLVGFTYYSGSFAPSTSSGDLAAMGLLPDAQGYGLLVATLMLAFLSALSLAVLLACYAKDIYGAQALLGALYLPVFLPSIILSFTPVEILPGPLQALLYALPFSYPSLAARAIFTHAYAPIWVGVVWQAVFTVVVLYFAARMFTTERLLTARLGLRRERKQAKGADE